MRLHDRVVLHLATCGLLITLALFSGCGGKVDNRFSAQTYDEYSQPLTNAVVGTPSGVIVAESVTPDGRILPRESAATPNAGAAAPVPIAEAAAGEEGGPPGTSSWSFDDCDPNSHFLIDSSGSGANAQRALGDNCVAGIAGQGVLIRSAKDVIQVPDEPQFTVGPRVGVAAWVHPNTTSGHRPVVIKRLNNQTSFSLGVHNGSIEMSIVLTTGETFISRAPIAAGVWTHVAGMYDGTFVFLFINGEQFGQVYAGGTIRNVFAPIRIGATTQNQFFDGIIDEVFLTTEAIDKSVLTSRACVRRPSTIAVTPAAGGPVPFDTSVHYDIAVSNNDAGFCPSKFYNVNLFVFEQGISTFFDFPPGQSAQIDPGTTAHFGLNVSGSEDAAIGVHQIPFDVRSFDPVFEDLSGLVTFELAIPSCFVFTRRELMITNTSVVDDPVRTNGVDTSGSCNPSAGVWTFGHLVRDAAPKPADAPAMTQQLFQHWLTDQTVNGFVVPARPAIQQNLFDVWPKTITGELDLDRAPLRLQAIVNRVDIRDLAAGSAGEGRFVFAVERNGFPEQFTVILEYNLPAKTEQDVLDWANLWHSLGSLPFPSEAYNAALEGITRRFTSRNASPGSVNGSALVSLRTNEIQLSFVWELREFSLETSTGFFEERPVTETPDLRFNGTSTFADFVNQNEAGILAEVPGATGHNVTPVFEGLNFQAGSSINFQPIWSAPGIGNPEARFHAAINTCNGCHGPETGTFNFTIITPRFFSGEAGLSPFLTGVTVSDPFTGQQRTLNDLARRRADLTSLVCSTDGGTASSPDGGGLPAPGTDPCTPLPPPPPPPEGGFCAGGTTCTPPACGNTFECAQLHDKPGSPFPCSSCLSANGCLNFPRACENVSFGFPLGCNFSTTEFQVCLKTFDDLLSAGCMHGADASACLCGEVSSADCLSGAVPPAGPILADYVCDFSRTDIAGILANFTNTTVGAGMANSIAQCAGSFGCDCF